MSPSRHKQLLDQLPPALRLALLFALALAYAAYSVRPQPPGITRLIMSLPVMLLFTLAPLHLQESIIICGSLAFMLCWLCNFKLLAYSGNRGPLAYPGLSTSQWLLMLLLPYFPAKKRGHARARSHVVLLSLVFKVALAAVLTVLLLSPLADPAGPPHSLMLRHTGYALYVWIFASLLLDLPVSLGCALWCRVELQPAMNNPFASISVREFWGRRYNQVVSCVLKDTVYDPIMDGSWVAVCGFGNEQRSATDAATNGGGGNNRGGAVAPRSVHVGANASCCSNGPGIPAATRQSKEGSRRRPATSSSPPPPPPEGICDLFPSSPPSANPVTAGYGSGGGGCGGGGSSTGQAHIDRRCQRQRVPCERRRLAAMSAAFLVSGVMHEVCMAYMCGGMLEGSFRMLGFFLIQPVIILAQDGASTAVAKWVPEQLSGSLAARALQTGVTLALVLGSAEWLFWPPMEACGADGRGLMEVMGVMRAVGGWFGKLAGRAGSAALE
ncbi:hypothetical protein VOLCADRAFT_98535 [Volvox carteri f. nagariensis]|uniref:Wax synthase domain-containing protein n=1 Tax=Volvox carteri f. nagariensis TaxID=3068 RepID=D8UFL3_VOLCA|nr:uncharacterized protein VOLCADRAFT_98535 [Volvox carteri f. nagariensis]EFJ41477.1 hypothetical protein VOLCADRAFT_98535 [Volvox carteri f. nagariensis]|eukprot:XP_002957422.1 hypothetical protein VOLCADRAFT_98535 [Volvox carteri f. nagariensis]